jgi:hypothetical protein
VPRSPGAAVAWCCQPRVWGYGRMVTGAAGRYGKGALFLWLVR